MTLHCWLQCWFKDLPTLMILAGQFTAARTFASYSSSLTRTW